ncbi:hypothetical protein [Mycoplasmoides gallisepticum]|uniref:hypothetical protein n=1 Tax=Mycoplasmoides gallisepticum TaxID=2096 RepID=UPI001AD8733D|nr:hypothetical protein [Mycoplasmoides gallisepticum]
MLSIIFLGLAMSSCAYVAVLKKQVRNDRVQLQVATENNAQSKTANLSKINSANSSVVNNSSIGDSTIISGGNLSSCNSTGNGDTAYLPANVEALVNSTNVSDQVWYKNTSTNSGIDIGELLFIKIIELISI